MCLYTKMIINPKYKKNKKNGGIIPPLMDNRVILVPIGCGQCIECRKQKANQWKIRLSQEVKKENKGWFVTLTFSNESIKEIDDKLKKDVDGWQRDNAIATYAVRHFLENWRKEYGKSVRHWFITELGHKGTENIHIHGIIWTDKGIEAIRTKWKYGFIFPKRKEDINKNYVTNKTINYITKYVTKVDKKNKGYKQVILTSNGIGNNYNGTVQHNNNTYKPNGKTDEKYRFENGGKSQLPIYYRNVAYTEDEREKLWIEKLDKQEIYVLGNKIDISKGEDDYLTALKIAREQNFNEGYGNGIITWEEQTNLRNKRNLMRATRIKNEKGKGNKYN